MIDIEMKIFDASVIHLMIKIYVLFEILSLDIDTF